VVYTKAIPSLKDGEGNVHTGATPPWMVDSTGSTIPTVATILTDAEKVRLQNRFKKKVNPRKLQPQGGVRYDQNWLPLFGRVFQSGPRSETRREFIEEVKSQKEFHKAVIKTNDIVPFDGEEGGDGMEEGGSDWQREKEKIMERIKRKRAT